MPSGLAGTACGTGDGDAGAQPARIELSTINHVMRYLMFMDCFTA
jgi:hypothetical protein